MRFATEALLARVPMEDGALGADTSLILTNRRLLTFLQMPWCGTEAFLGLKMAGMGSDTEAVVEGLPLEDGALGQTQA